MDKCVKPSEHMSPSDYDYTITYDFQLLDPGPDDPAFVQGKRYFGPEVMVQKQPSQPSSSSSDTSASGEKVVLFGQDRFLSQFLYFSNIYRFVYYVIDRR